VTSSLFVDSICRSFEQNPVPATAAGPSVDDNRVFIWDNLHSHLTDLVCTTVQRRPSPNQFVIVPRPPYQPKLGPIEYAICEIAGRLERCNIRDTAGMIQQIHNAVGQIGRDGKFSNTFAHCGY